MVDPTNRLVRCFLAVFKNLPDGQVPAASIENVPGWDSLATVTLAAVLEQEFGVQIDVFDLPNLTSFAAAHEFLKERNLLS